MCRNVVRCLFFLLALFSCSKNHKVKGIAYSREIIVVEKAITFNKDSIVQLRYIGFTDKISDLFRSMDRDTLIKAEHKDLCFIIGERRVFDSRLLLFSNTDISEGYLLFLNKNTPTYKLKVYQNHIDSGSILEAFFYKNFILLKQTVNPDFDFVVEGIKSNNIMISFVIIEIKKSGELKVLGEADALQFYKRNNLKFL
ncbi:hypothetical protein U1E44_06735 [Arenibacter sp. GZD96]|uniref:hypothetical protein n=1 Tax=Aurantibrevibacter litoralis TaxID=3106030 RepID=UPI002AFDCCA0|nr:hypothetical protein [Arenibacter sp. GZD-96]MEA1785780.1 hypothetical protein [Arenibacter sp. GZD-96]